LIVGTNAGGILASMLLALSALLRLSLPRLAGAVALCSGCVAACLSGCASSLPEDDFDLLITRGGQPWSGAVVMVQPMDRRNAPVNPVDVSQAIDYISRPAPEARLGGRTDASGRVRIRTFSELSSQLCILGPGGTSIIAVLEPMEDESADSARLLVPFVYNDPATPQVAITLTPAASR